MRLESVMGNCGQRHYETTVCASMPLIMTNDEIRTRLGRHEGK